MGVGLWRLRLRDRRRRMWICLGMMNLLRLRGRARRSRRCRDPRRKHQLLHQSRRDRVRVYWGWISLVDRIQLLLRDHRVLVLQRQEFQDEQILNHPSFHFTHLSQLQHRNLTRSSNLNQTWEHSQGCNRHHLPRRLNRSLTHNLLEA